MAAAMLESHGIPATVVGDDAGGAGGINLAAGGYQLAVPDDLQGQAEALLEPVSEPRQPVDDAGGSRRPIGLQLAVVLVLVVVVLVVLSSLVT